MAIDESNASTGDAPTDFESPPSHLNLPHSLELNIPLVSAFQAQALYKVMSIDKPLRPNDTHIAFRIKPSEPSSHTTLDISLHTTSVRQLRLSSNAILDDVSLILETMEAFPNNEEGKKAEEINLMTTSRAKDEEFELSGTGRAG